MVIAPTYIIIIMRGIKSIPMDINKPDDSRNTKTSQRIECIGLNDSITITMDVIIKREKMINN